MPIWQITSAEKLPIKQKEKNERKIENSIKTALKDMDIETEKYSRRNCGKYQNELTNAKRTA